MTNLKTIINAMPERLQTDYAKNQDGFSGNTTQMNEAGYNMVANLQHMWTDIVSSGFPAGAFGTSPAQWISNYVKQQTQLYGVLNEPQGPGTGGTIVGQLIAGDMMEDLQQLISKTVKALIWTPDNTAEYKTWEGRWKAVQP